MKVLLISGTKCVGKDTMADRLAEVCYTYPVAFADALREDLAPFVRQHYGWDIWAMTPQQKEIVRPLLIAHGCGMRALDPLHWVKRAVTKAERGAKEAAVYPCIIYKDGRFVNEVEHLRGRYGDELLHLDLTRKGAPPPTEEEERNYRQVRTLADMKITWGDDSVGMQQEVARQVIAAMDLSPLTLR